MNNNFGRRALVPLISMLALAAAMGAGAEEVTMNLKSTGATKDLGGYIPQRLVMSATRPAGLKKAPEGLTSALYGELKFGPKETPKSYYVIVDEPEGKPARLWVDQNGDGDLTDESQAEWTGKVSKSKDGKETTMYSGGATLKAGSEDYHLKMYRFDKSDTARAALANTLLYYIDYARYGKVTLDGKSYNAMLVDDGASGDFRAPKDAKMNPVHLLLDLNEDAKFDRRRESFDTLKPFNIGGTTYEIKNLAASGRSFEIAKSKEMVEETKAAPILEAGHKALEFEAKKTDGEPVKFPTAYHGKLVMLDFWATWCAPCRGEIPGLVAAYKKYHPKGFDVVLGISLDKPNESEKLSDFTKEYKMDWPQVYDGKFWSAAVATQYLVQSIPQAFLVDGDTGEIVATGNSLRGEELDATLEKALAKKGAKVD